MAIRSSRSPSLEHHTLMKKIAWVIALGVLLNPLNSSMIAVALTGIGNEFQINIATVTWLLSGFYLAGAIGPSLAGKFADLFGARKVFIVGLVLVLISSIVAVSAPNFSTLLIMRVLQALGSSVAFPAGMSMLRAVAVQSDEKDQTNQISSSLALVSIMANVTAAFGPTLGGILVGTIGWQSIFWVNIPITILTIGLAYRILPQNESSLKIKDKHHDSMQSILQRLDVVGIGLFISMLIALMLFLLSLSSHISWWLLVSFIVLFIAFIFWEKRTAIAFINIRMITSNTRLRFVYLQYIGVNIVFYSLFFCIPLWLEQVKGFDPAVTGLLMLPLAGFGVIMTSVAVRCNKRFNYRMTIIVGNVLLVLSTALLLVLGENSSILIILVVNAILGMPNGFNNMGLQTALYDVTTPEETGVASGLYATFRSIGSILSTSLLGAVFGGALGSSGLHMIALIAMGIGIVLFLTSLSRRWI